MDRLPFILLVEDDEDEKFLAERALSKAGLKQVQHIPDGLQAKAFLEEVAAQSSPTKPDIVLMDLKLPGLHGQQVLEWMATRSELGGLLRYVLSSSGNPLDREAAARANVDGYLMKPLTVADVEQLKQTFKDKAA